MNLTPTHASIHKHDEEKQHLEDHPHTHDCGCSFTPTLLELPQVIQDTLEIWDDASNDVVLEVKNAFVKLIPALGPVETFKMAMGKARGSSGFVAIFIDRPYKEATITPDKKQIWLLE